MNIYIDCEFNGFGGKLISMALVADSGEEFYEVIEMRDQLDPWVANNVVPILNKSPISYSEFQDKILEFLNNFNDIKVIADWPDDLKYFMEALITGPGLMLPIRRVELFMNRKLSAGKSILPHNALEDARAIMRSNI